MAERTATHADSAGHILRQILYRVVWRIRGCRRHRRCRVQRSFVLVPARNGGRAPLFAAPRRMGTAFPATFFGSKSQFLSWASWAAPYLIPCPIVKFVIWRMRLYRGMGAGLAGWCVFLESAEPAMAADMCLSARVTRGHTQGRPGSAPSGQLLCNVLVRSGLRRYRTCARLNSRVDCSLECCLPFASSAS